MSDVINAHDLGVAGGYIIEAAMQGDIDQLKAENAKLRELAARAWRLFTENGAVHPSDLSEVDTVRDGLRELGVEVDE